MVFLLRLIKKNLYLLTYLFLLGLAISQVFRFNIYQRSYYFNTSNSFFNSFSRVKTSVTSYFNLRHANNELVAENKKLREELGATKSAKTDISEHTKTDSAGKNLYTYITAGVIQSGTNMQNNFITIDKGSADGVTKDMAVISPSGIAGIVLETTENFSLVLSALNPQFKATPMIPAIDFRDGSVSWNGKNPNLIQLNGVSRFEKVKTGMQVLTSNYSVKFPPGIPVGKIAAIRNTGKSSFYEIDLVPATDFRRLSHVYIVKNRFINQTDTLQRRANRGN